MRYFYVVPACMILLGLTGHAQTNLVKLSAAKDSFMRSNEQIRSSGGSEYLVVAHAPHVRSLVAFDLSGITNTIEKATLQIRMAKSMDTPLTLVVAPMIATKNNGAWGEGSGRLGTKGQNAAVGVATYIRSAAPDVPWEAADGAAVASLGAEALWGAAAVSLREIVWVDGKQLEIPMPVGGLNAAVESEHKGVTWGLWGIAGNGIYHMGSKESEHAPILILTLKNEQREDHE